MKVSIIICSYVRPHILPACLKAISAETSTCPDVEIVLVHRVSDQTTVDVMKKFATTSVTPVKIVGVERRGLSAARNTGIAAASGDLLIFTDDDCVMQSGYLAAVLSTMEAEPDYAYGGGGVRDAVFSAPDTTHLSHLGYKAVAKPRTLIGAGIFSGCNMFFRRKVFEQIGLFREDMGAGCGMPFVGAEDLEMTTRANFAGMTGVLIPGAVIVHNHGRMQGSPELAENSVSYDISRGSFYAYMMMRGVHEIWSFWAETARPDDNRKVDRRKLEALQRELYGAASYLDHCLKNNIDVT